MCLKHDFQSFWHCIRGLNSGIMKNSPVIMYWCKRTLKLLLTSKLRSLELLPPSKEWLPAVNEDTPRISKSKVKRQVWGILWGREIRPEIRLKKCILLVEHKILVFFDKRKRKTSLEKHKNFVFIYLQFAYDIFSVSTL